MFTTLVLADTGVPQVPETQGFTTATDISALGTVTETDNIVFILTNWHGASTLPYPLGKLPNEVEYTSTYSEDTLADQGLVTYAKEMIADSAGMAADNQYNVKASKIVDFVGTDIGRMTSSENSVVDGAGTQLYNEFIMICPFASSGSTWNPAFCNIVEQGSNVDLTIGSLATSADQRFIMQKGVTVINLNPFVQYDPIFDLPISDPGVAADYSVKLTGFEDVPAMGSVESYINVHVQEGRSGPGGFLGLDYPKAEDLVYSESTTTSGEITLFHKVMNYHSRITSPGSTSQPI